MKKKYSPLDKANRINLLLSFKIFLDHVSFLSPSMSCLLLLTSLYNICNTQLFFLSMCYQSLGFFSPVSLKVGSSQAFRNTEVRSPNIFGQLQNKLYTRKCEENKKRGKISWYLFVLLFFV